MNVAIISLHPLDSWTSSERFTLDSIQSVRAGGDVCDVFAIQRLQPPVSPGGDSARRQSTVFVHSFDSESTRSLPFRDLLKVLGQFEVVWVQQYLACDLIFDIIAAIRPDQRLLMTDLGYAPLQAQFAGQFEPARNQWFVEPLEALTTRSRHYGRQAITVSGGVWLDLLGVDRALSAVTRGQLGVMGGALAETGIETALLAAPEGSEVTLAGGRTLPAERITELRQLAGRNHVTFSGQVPDVRRRNVMKNAEAAMFRGGEVGRLDLCGFDILEALTEHTLPVAADCGTQAEVMHRIGLGDLLFPPDDASALSEVLDRIARMPREERDTRLIDARLRIRESFLWDTWWDRASLAVGLRTSQSAFLRADLFSSKPSPRANKWIPAPRQPHLVARAATGQ